MDRTIVEKSDARTSAGDGEEVRTMGVPTGVWVAAFVILIVIAWVTFWVTNKAYSRKWEDSEDPKQ